MSHHRHKHYKRREPLPLDKDGMFHFERGVVHIGHPPENPFDRDIKEEKARLKRIWYAYRLIDTGGKWTGNYRNYPYSPTVAFIDARGNYYKILPPEQPCEQQIINFAENRADQTGNGYVDMFTNFIERITQPAQP